MNTKVNLCGIEIDNPVIPASGTFGFGQSLAENTKLFEQHRIFLANRYGYRNLE